LSQSIVSGQGNGRSKRGKNIRKQGKEVDKLDAYALASVFPFWGSGKMSIKTSQQDRNEQLIRRLYDLAEAASKDTAKFVSLFADGGYFYDVSSGKKYYGHDIGLTVDVYAAAFPDRHRELYDLYFYDDVVVVELSLNGTHKGDLVTPAGTIPATGKEIHAPCCDVFRIENGKVTSFHCYLAATIIQAQLGLN
jgi:ketosteroid isomerase-like protein